MFDYPVQEGSGCADGKIPVPPEKFLGGGSAVFMDWCMSREGERWG
jgi:hypothetical protein